MPLPSSLLQAAENNPVLVELKDGTTYNGTLVNTDSFMNVNLRDVTCTSKEGAQFWKLSECYVRGSTIKYFRMSEDLLEQIPTEDHRPSSSSTRGGALLVLDASLKFYMSHLRVGGAVGEGDLTSLFEKMSKIQLLTSEYVPGLVLAMALSLLKGGGALSSAQRWLFRLAVLGRYVFVLRAWDGSVNAKGYGITVKGHLSPAGFIGATSAYIAYFGLGLGLLW